MRLTSRTKNLGAGSARGCVVFAVGGGDVADAELRHSGHPRFSEDRRSGLPCPCRTPWRSSTKSRCASKCTTRSAFVPNRLPLPDRGSNDRRPGIIGGAPEASNLPPRTASMSVWMISASPTSTIFTLEAGRYSISSSSVRYDRMKNGESAPNRARPIRQSAEHGKNPRYKTGAFANVQ